MYSAYLERSKSTIDELIKHIRTGERLRSLVFDETISCKSEIPCFTVSSLSKDASPNSVEWKIIDHCASVTRIYAIYEQFIHEMVSEHLGLLQSRITFYRLPESLKNNYRIGISKLIDRIHTPRYSDVELTKIVANYNNALAGQNYSLEPKAMLIQDQNLRLDELARLLRNCAIDNVKNWITEHRSLKRFFDENDPSSSTAESQMAELVKYRNDAAHGSIEVNDILDPNGLVEYCHFIEAICEAVYELILSAGLKCLQQHNHVSCSGKLSEVLKDGFVGIGTIQGPLHVGQSVFVNGKDYCFEATVTSMRVDDVEYKTLDGNTEAEVGLGFDIQIKKGAEILIFRENLILVDNGASHIKECIGGSVWTRTHVNR